RVERIELLGIALQERRIVVLGVLPVQHRAPGDAPLDGAGFVEGEVHPAMIAQEAEDFFVAVFLERSRRRGVGIRRAKTLSRAGGWPRRATAGGLRLARV